MYLLAQWHTYADYLHFYFLRKREMVRDMCTSKDYAQWKLEHWMPKIDGRITRDI